MGYYENVDKEKGSSAPGMALAVSLMLTFCFFALALIGVRLYQHFHAPNETTHACRVVTVHYPFENPKYDKEFLGDKIWPCQTGDRVWLRN
jgi:hypothetical protein